MNPPISLAGLPVSGKLLLTAFLVLIGVGYLAAVGNLYNQHELADEKPGLTIDDLRATFHGIEVKVPESAANAVPKSRMLEMVEPAGEMRKHAAKDGPEAIRALEAWLNRGALEAEFTKASLTQEGDPSADDVIGKSCLRCHNVEKGEKSETPYGPDIFTTDYKMIYKYAAPGTALHKVDPSSPGVRRLGPISISHLFLTTHIHMLSIPVFTLIVGGMFMCTGGSGRAKAILAPLPMLTLSADFAGWWLARVFEPVIYSIAVTGGLFGLSIGIQIVVVMWSIWFGRTPADTDPGLK